MTNYKYLGWGRTNQNGVAHLEYDPNGEPINGYTGTGAGEVGVVASLDNPITDSSLVSEIYEVLDCTIYEVITSTTHQNLWYASANVGITYTDNGVNFKGVNTSTDRIGLALNNDKLFLDLDSDWCLELDVTSANLCSFYFTQADNETGAEFISSTGLGLETGVKSTAKFEYSTTNRKVSCYLDGTYKDFLDLSNFTQGIGFRVVDWQGDADITFQNIKVYPI